MAEDGPFGSKGTGEHDTNAVADALQDPFNRYS